MKKAKKKARALFTSLKNRTRAKKRLDIKIVFFSVLYKMVYLHMHVLND